MYYDLHSSVLDIILNPQLVHYPCFVWRVLVFTLTLKQIKWFDRFGNIQSLAV